MLYNLPMSSPIGTWRLGNGLSVEMIDETKLLSGTYYQVKLVIVSKIRIKDEYLTGLRDNPRYNQIVKRLSPSTQYRREIVKTGVEERTLLEEKTRLIKTFEENALIYFEREDFPAKYVQKQFLELEKELTTQ
jgi:hypothetical protein